MRLKDLIQKYAVAVLPRMFLEWQGYEIPKSAFGRCVSAWEETIVRIQSDSWRFSIVRVNRAQPSCLTFAAATGQSKKSQMCAPFPDRERSTAIGT